MGWSDGYTYIKFNPTMKIFIKLQEYAIYAFFFSLNFEMMNLFNLDINYLASKITISILLFLTIINIKTLVNIKHFSKYIIPLIIYFVLLTFVSYKNRSSSYNVFFDFLLFLNILIFLILINHSKLKYDVLLKGLFVFALGNIILSILYFLGVAVTDPLDGRFTVFGMNQNFLGLNLCISIFILASIVFENKLEYSKMRFLLLLPIPFIFIFMAKTGSRVALISFVIGIFVYILSNKSIKSIKKLLVIFSAFIMFVIFWQLFLKDSFVVERLLTSINQGDMAYRDVIWISLYNIFSDNFIYGVGKTGYAMVTGGISPHNVIIEVLCYTGIIGLLVFLNFIFRIVNNAYKRRKNDGELLPIVLVLPILGMILTGQIFEHKIFWALFAYIGGWTLIKNESNKVN